MQIIMYELGCKGAYAAGQCVAYLLNVPSGSSPYFNKI